jgi:hypothetical protein
MKRIPFSESELTAVGTHIATSEPVMPAPLKYATPITPRENMLAALRREKPLWLPLSGDMLSIESRVNLDHVARAEVRDLGPVLKIEEKGGPDLFGVEWVFVPMVGGSMVKPGLPILEDANDWEKIIKFPDIDALDWESCAAVNTAVNETERLLSVTFQNGIFERLISFMDFQGAALALVDDEQKEAVHKLFTRLCDMYEAMITKYLECLRLEMVVFHDDWGSQRAPFFSLETCREMVMPYIKRLADFCHSKGLLFQQHCCGKNELLVPAMIEAGVDMWIPQQINDVDVLRREYGDKIIFGVWPSPLPQDASDEETAKAAKAFAEKYTADFERAPVVAVTFGVGPKFGEALYKASRIAFNP